MKKFCVKGTRRACLDDRLKNAKRWVHTDLRAVEAKIYRIANMSMDYYFQNKRAFGNFQRMASEAGFYITPGTSYMEAASKIKQYVMTYPEDEQTCIDLITLFLFPICRFAGQLVWRGDPPKSNTGKSNTEHQKKKSGDDSFRGDLHAMLEENHMREFYVWMNEYASVLDDIFPEDDYLTCFDDEIYVKAPFEKSIPIVMKFVQTILYDKDTAYDKWHLLMKFMIDPYDQLYRRI